VPDGQIISDFRKWCQARESKIFLFFRNPNQAMVRPSHPTKGALAIVTNVGGDVVDAAASAREAVAGRFSVSDARRADERR
jgi:hypothetical protein